MGRDFWEKKLSCGCIESVSDHDFFNQRETSIQSRCEYHQKIHEELRQQQEKEKQKCFDKFVKDCENLEIKLTPIKYLHEINRNREREGPNWIDGHNYFDNDLFHIQKIKNRYYCCKNRVDVYIKNKLYNYYFIKYSPYSKLF
jgi:hypothetical protein